MNSQEAKFFGDTSRERLYPEGLGGVMAGQEQIDAILLGRER